MIPPTAPPAFASEALRLQPGRLKYLLGELVLASWKPLLAQVPGPVVGVRPALPELAMLADALPAEADGYLFRKLDATQLPPGISRHGPYLAYVPYRDVLYYVTLEGSFEDYLKTFSAKARQNLNRSVKRFLERDPVRNREQRFDHPDAMAEFHQRAVGISARTYQARLLDSGLPASERFLQGMIDLAQTGHAQGYLLHQGDEAVAFAWCRGQDSRLIYDVVGYLQEHASSSPGSVLLYLILKQAFAEQRYRIFDFGPGESQYKAMFATHRQEFIDVYLFRNTWGNRLRLSAYHHLARLSGGVGAWLESVGLKKRIKSLMRRLK